MPKSKLLKHGDENRLIFWCCGCNHHHGVPIDGPRRWEWNQSFDKPTLSPSVLITYDGPTSELPPRCHLFLRDGMLQYLDDCAHGMAGKTVELVELEL